jgi:hypothetical protein
MPNLLAPLEFDDIWAARKFCKYNRCALCLGEIIPKITEPYDDFIKAHYNVECENHGLLITGGTAGVKIVHGIEIDEQSVTYLNRCETNRENDKSNGYSPSDKRLLEELGF